MRSSRTSTFSDEIVIYNTLSGKFLTIFDDSSIPSSLHWHAFTDSSLTLHIRDDMHQQSYQMALIDPKHKDVQGRATYITGN
jgi:hypothetical protein